MTALLDLRAEVTASPLELPAAELDASARQRAIVTWRGRMVSEHVSARVFGSLVGQAMRAGLSRTQVQHIADMVDQELEHALLCARAVMALGGEPVAALPDDLPDVPRHRDAAPLEALLRNVLSVSCLHETLAVALVGCEREQVGPRELHDIFSVILRDEVQHARFGWLLLDDVSDRLDDSLRERLGAYLIGAFEHLVTHYAPLASAPGATDVELRYGASDGPGNWRLVLDTIHHVVLPGLERHGIPADAAWHAATLANV